jgi:hypothetical protein
MKEKILDDQHWTFKDYKQRIEAKHWKALLLNEDDKIVFKGRVVQLVAKNLGCGVYEISKQVEGDHGMD